MDSWKRLKILFLKFGAGWLGWLIFLANGAVLARDAMGLDGFPKSCTVRFVSAGFGAVILLIQSGWRGFSGRCRSGGFAVLRALEPGEHPEVVREDRPADDAFARKKQRRKQ